MDVIVRVNNQTNGRDKLARLAQYVSRLIWHQLESRNVNKYSIERIRSLENSLSSFRKVLRLGRCIDTLYSALNTIQLEDPWLRFTLTLSKVAQALFLYADHVVWLSRSGFFKAEADWNKIANKFWLVSIIANLARDFYEIIHILEMYTVTLLKPSQFLSGPMKNVAVSDSLKHLLFLVNCHKDVFVDTVKNSCDLFIPLTALGYTKFSPSVVGTLGAVSSLAALVTLVKPITKLVPA